MKPARDPNAPRWQPGPIPETISVRLAGLARDEAGAPVAGAVITLYSITDKGSKPLGTAKTDESGRYTIADAPAPVQSSFNGRPFRPELTPYASFLVSGVAPGLGIAWGPQQSVYALKEPHPDDIQGRLPLGQLVTTDLAFPKAAALEGKVVDDEGLPVHGAKLQILDCDLLDESGRETNNRQGFDWKVLPDSLGRAVTARDGRFRMEGLADRACYWIQVKRPETDNASLAFYAATIDGPDTVHEQLPPDAFNGRGRHDAKTSPITVLFPVIRPIAVTVIGDDTGKPLAGARVRTLSDTGATGIASYGTTNAEGKVLLGLPPGRYQGILSGAPSETNYIRTDQRPLIVARGEGPQPIEIRQQAGAEVIIEAVRTGKDEPVVGAFFWMAPDDKPDATDHISPTTVRSGEPWTNAKGELRAVFPPEPGRRYRFRFAGIHEPNHPPGIHPATAKKLGYEAFPSQSAPVELIAGKTTRLRFILRRTDAP